MAIILYTHTHIYIYTYLYIFIHIFLVRAYEHLLLSYKTGKKYTFKESTATTVAKHHHSNHTASIEDFKIISKVRHDFHTKIKVALLIKKDNPSLNISSDSIPLYLFN